MSSEERDIILQMVAENKITTAEASDLLDALGEVEAEERQDASGWIPSEDLEESLRHGREVLRGHKEARRAEREARRWERDVERQARHRERRGWGEGGAARTLLIHVSEGEKTRTHLQIPLGVALAAGRFIPRKARVFIEEYGIDIGEILDSLANDFSRVGEIVNVRDGDNHVLIAVQGGHPTASPVQPVAPVPPVTPEPTVPPVPPITPERPATSSASDAV